MGSSSRTSSALIQPVMRTRRSSLWHAIEALILPEAISLKLDASHKYFPIDFCVTLVPIRPWPDGG